MLAIVQLTLREEAEPVVEGGRRLVDVEGRGELDLVIDEAAIRDYRAGSAVCGWACRGRPPRGRRFAHVVAGTPVRDGARTGGGGSVGGRMMFTTPLGLLALLAIPAIVAIHLFRRRFPGSSRRRAVPLADRPTDAGRGGKITRLPITTSLILECLAALALALILAGARLSSAGVSPHLVVLLDDSASMAAVNARARARAIARCAACSGSSIAWHTARASRSSGAAIVRRCSGRRRAPSKRGRRWKTWKPEAPHHSLALGLRLARELAGRTGRLMVMSDVPPALAATATSRALWVSLGEPLANVGILGAERTISPGEGRARCR